MVVNITQAISEVFNKFLQNKEIFTDRSALTIAFEPHTIPHREKQIADLSRIVAPALKGGKPSNVFIYGRTGTGKTVVSKLVGQELEKISGSNGKKVKVVYVNCKMKNSADTEYRLLASLSKEFGKVVPFTGLPTDQVYQYFYQAVDSKKQTNIIIIDEIDSLVAKNGDELLYNLTRMNQDLKNSQISFIGITNNLNFIECLEPRVRSSLSEEELIFPPYNAMQLQDILRERAKSAFAPGSLAEGVIEKCAALAAQEHGDARRALDLLRVAGELAERNAEEKVNLAHVDMAQEKIDTDRIIETMKNQPRQSQAVLYSIIQLAEKSREIETNNIIDRYQEVCQQHGLKVLTQRRVSDLIAELYLFGIIDYRVVSKGRYGRTRIVKISLSDSVKKKLVGLLNETFL